MEQVLKLNKLSYIDNIHGRSKGWITRSIKDKKGYRQCHYKYTELKELGADRQVLGATRIFKVPGSKNSKSSTVVSAIDGYKRRKRIRNKNSYDREMAKKLPREIKIS